MKSRVVLRNILFLGILTASRFAYAESEIVASLNWSYDNVPELAALRHDQNEGPILEVSANRRALLSLWSLDQPAVESAAHAIRGRIRVAAVSGNAQFEMWTCFGDDSDWYSLTLVSSNASGQHSEWVDFEVPFDLGGDYAPGFPPNKMLLALDLPEGGLLWLSSLELVQYPK